MALERRRRRRRCVGRDPRRHPHVRPVVALGVLRQRADRALAIAAAYTLLTETRRLDADRSLDIAGAVTATAGLSALVYGIVGTDTHGWGSAHTLVPLAISALLLAASSSSRRGWLRRR